MQEIYKSPQFTMFFFFIPESMSSSEWILNYNLYLELGNTSWYAVLVLCIYLQKILSLLENNLSILKDHEYI